MTHRHHPDAMMAMITARTVGGSAAFLAPSTVGRLVGTEDHPAVARVMALLDAAMVTAALSADTAERRRQVWRVNAIVDTVSAAGFAYWTTKRRGRTRLGAAAVAAFLSLGTGISVAQARQESSSG